MLDNPRSDRIKRVAALSGRSARKKTGLALVEGPQAVRELIRFHPGSVKDVYVTEWFKESHPDLDREILHKARWVHVVSQPVMSKVSGEAQGVVAVAESALLVREWQPGPGQFVVLLPETQDPGNLGTLIRTADAMGASAIFLGEGTCEVLNPKVIRASAGSVFHLPIIRQHYLDSVTQLQGRGFVLLGTALSEFSASLDSLLLDGVADPKQSALGGLHAWVFGNEARGLSPAQAGVLDQLVHIEMAGQAESLNVAAAAAMCLFASAAVRRNSATDASATRPFASPTVHRSKGATG